MPPHGYRSIETTQCSLEENKFITNKKVSTTARKSCNRFSSEEVSKHDTSEDCWVIHDNFVYNVTEFLEKHPGGAELILNHGGKDITDLFHNENFHRHSSAAHNLLRDYRIGRLKKKVWYIYLFDLYFFLIIVID